MVKPTDVYVQPGGEGYVKWARNRLGALGACRRDLRLPSLQKHFTPASGTRISLLSSEFGDRIRIFNASGTVSGLIVVDNLLAQTPELIAAQAAFAAALAAFFSNPNAETLAAARAAQAALTAAQAAATLVPSSLLDATETDYGLFLPVDVNGLPDSFKYGSSVATRTPPYRGMIVNHAFNAQHPSKYTDINQYLTSASAWARHLRYYPRILNGLFLVRGYWSDGSDVKWTYTWISGANDNNNANLTLNIAEDSFFIVTGGTLPAIIVSNPLETELIAEDGAVYLERLLYDESPVVGGNVLRGIYQAYLEHYYNNATPTVSISLPLEANSYGGGLAASTYNETVQIVPARANGVNYIFSGVIRWSINLDVSGFLSSEISRTGTLSLRSASEVVFSESIADVAVLGPQNRLVLNGGKVKTRTDGTRDYVVVYNVPNLVNNAGPIYLRTNAGTETVVDDLAQPSHMYEHQLDISSTGQAGGAGRYLLGGGTYYFVKIQGASTYTFPVNTPSHEPSATWTLDGRYLLVKLIDRLYIFSTAGALLGSVELDTLGGTSFEITDESPLAGFFVTGRANDTSGSYTVVMVGQESVWEFPLRITHSPFVMSVTEFTRYPPNNVESPGWTLDDLRRPYP